MENFSDAQIIVVPVVSINAKSNNSATKPEAYASGFAFAIMILSQRFTHCRAGVRFRYGIKVAINIRSGAHIAVPEPFLDLLHGHALCEEHRCAGVAKVVEADLLQVMLLQKPAEVFDRPLKKEPHKSLRGSCLCHSTLKLSFIKPLMF